MSPEALLILKVIDLAVFGLEAGTDLWHRFQDLRAKVQVFRDEDRDPTPEEWAELDAELERNSAIIQGS